MIKVELDMPMPAECHECPFQLKFKEDEQDNFYVRRCIFAQRMIQYPKPEWCPLQQIEETKPAEAPVLKEVK